MTLASRLQQVQQRIDDLLAAQLCQLDDHAPRLKEAMEYSLLAGGKRMRPLLVYATGELLNVAQQDLDPIAVAIECIHAYSLVHDDLPAMDDDHMRRGQPTCHVAFDEATAILAGDALQTLAFDALSGASYSAQARPLALKLVSILARASGHTGMAGGQAMDLAATDQTIDQVELQILHQKKTGALLSAAISMPATLATDLDPHHFDTLTAFADILGLAFQVQDDILDVVSDSETLGKPQGSDQARNKSTYPALMGLDGARSYLQKLHQEGLQALATLPYNTQTLQSILDYTVERDH